MNSELPFIPADSLLRRKFGHFEFLRLLSVFIVGMLAFASANADEAQWKTLKVGHQGISKVSCWVPVTAQATGLPPSTSVSLVCDFSDPRGDRFLQSVATATTSSTGDVDLSGYFLVGRQDGSGQISIAATGSDSDNAPRPTSLLKQSVFHSGDVDLSEIPTVASDLKLHRLDVPFLMTYGNLTGIPELLDSTSRFSSKQTLLEGLTLPSVNDLPEDAKGFSGTEMLILAGSFDCNRQQADAIQEWVLSGGHLFVSTGSNVTELKKNQSFEWLTSLFEVQEKSLSVRDLTALQSYVAASDPGVTALRTRRAREGIQMAEFGGADTTVDVSSLNEPILGRQSLGGGIIQFLGVDVNQKPLSEWNSLPQFYEVLLLGGKLSNSTTGGSRTARISQSGVSDLGSQLMSSVDGRAKSSQWSTWAVMGLMAVYLILIGPVDYVLVTQIFKRPSLTWVTFPCMVLFGSILLFSFTRGSTEFQSIHLDIVDVMPYADGDAVKLRSLVSVRPNQTSRSNLHASIDDSLSDVFSVPPDLRWAGRPEDVFGGMYRVGGVGLGQRQYDSTSEDSGTLRAVPLLVEGSRELSIEAFSRSKKRLVETDLSVSGFGLISGHFVSQLPFDVTDWMIMYGNRIYRSRAENSETTIQPGSTIHVNRETLYASDLKSFLNASRIVKEQTGPSVTRRASQVLTPYDKQSQDAMYILTRASFYETSGGYKYVGLGNSMVKSLDASDSIRLNHAVLIGIGSSATSSIEVKNGEPPVRHSQTLVRIFLPVAQRTSAAIASPQQD